MHAEMPIGKSKIFANLKHFILPPRQTPSPQNMDTARNLHNHPISPIAKFAIAKDTELSAIET